MPPVLRAELARRAGKKKLFGKREVLPGVGVYRMAGSGVGKTHPLASTYYAPSAVDVAPTAFATFGEPTQLARSAHRSASICWPTTWWCASTSSNSTIPATPR